VRGAAHGPRHVNAARRANGARRANASSHQRFSHQRFSHRRFSPQHGSCQGFSPHRSAVQREPSRDGRTGDADRRRPRECAFSAQSAPLIAARARDRAFFARFRERCGSRRHGCLHLAHFWSCQALSSRRKAPSFTASAGRQTVAEGASAGAPGREDANATRRSRTPAPATPQRPCASFPPSSAASIA